MKIYISTLAVLVFIGASLAALAQGPDYTIQGSVWGDVYFGTGSAALTEKARKDLDDVSAWIKKRPTALVLLAGYDDQRTPEADSIELGAHRATSVSDYLASHGVDPGKINMMSFGNTKLAVTGSGEEVWSKNRRVRYRVVEPTDNGKMEGMPSGVCQRCKK
jgi:peptidoglycan-associated lipoprotein